MPDDPDRSTEILYASVRVYSLRPTKSAPKQTKPAVMPRVTKAKVRARWLNSHYQQQQHMHPVLKILGEKEIKQGVMGCNHQRQISPYRIDKLAISSFIP